ncbi:hypothetical protein QAD02_001431 [Eretmocerus hayati]|uniref:Uncharacterized protein n=1 Tax=Eretmocerus hayati TaxID=131215 RepID=A0ACC2NG98_9HYME|nr:hypothetical protein QAD02_001431 [Eretmocerus hayati]
MERRRLLILCITFILCTILLVVFCICLLSNKKKLSNRAVAVAFASSVPDIPGFDIVFELNNGRDPTRSYDWRTDNVALGEVTRRLNVFIKELILNRSELSNKIIKSASMILNNFVLEYRDHLKKFLSATETRLSRVPYGKNWYQFSVDSTCFLAGYILYGFGERTNEAEETIMMIIENPKRSLGYERDGVNSVFLVGPWSLVRGFESVQQDESYRYVIDYLDIPIVEKPMDAGLHRDGSFLFHKTIVSGGYLKALRGVLVDYFILFDTNVDASKITKIRSRFFNILGHPYLRSVTVPSLFSRVPNPRLYDINFSESTYGLEAMPLSGVLRLNIPIGQFMMKINRNNLGFYESDKSNYMHGMDALMRREYFYKREQLDNFAESWPFPGLFVTKDENWNGDPKTIKRKKLESETSTTMVHYVNDCVSFLFVYDGVGYAYQKYSKTKLIDTPFVREFVRIDTRNREIMIWFHAPGYTYYYGMDETFHKVSEDEESNALQIIYTYDERGLLSDQSYKHVNFPHVKHYEDPFKRNVSIYVAEKNENIAYILKDEGDEKLLFPVNITETASIDFNGIVYDFDEKINQYSKR